MSMASPLTVQVELILGRKIEGMRIPAVMKHPEYKKDPWAAIRLHASNTLESAPVVAIPSNKPQRARGSGEDMEGIDQCEFRSWISLREMSLRSGSTTMSLEIRSSKSIKFLSAYCGCYTSTDICRCEPNNKNQARLYLDISSP